MRVSAGVSVKARARSIVCVRVLLGCCLFVFFGNLSDAHVWQLGAVEQQSAALETLPLAGT